MISSPLAGPADRALWTRAVVGDAHAFTSLVRRHQSAVRGFLRRLSGDPATADDLAQETFWKAHKALASWRGEGSLLSWLLSVAWRTWLSERRKVRHSREVVDDDAKDSLQAHRGVERTSRDVERDVQRAMLLLSDDERAAIALCFQSELTHEEAALVLHMPLGTLKSHVARAKEKLRAALESYSPATTEAA
ncbi:MAG: RNA polymerase sigma factor [Deltaproteobacteria bacterium]|nr:RNA polymerase sigma factor [Deltaproteobacteria bacterium]